MSNKDEALIAVSICLIVLFALLGVEHVVYCQ